MFIALHVSTDERIIAYADTRKLALLRAAVLGARIYHMKVKQVLEDFNFEVFDMSKTLAKATDCDCGIAETKSASLDRKGHFHRRLRR